MPLIKCIYVLCVSVTIFYYYNVILNFIEFVHIANIFHNSKNIEFNVEKYLKYISISFFIGFLKLFDNCLTIFFQFVVYWGIYTHNDIINKIHTNMILICKTNNYGIKHSLFYITTLITNYFTLITTPIILLANKFY